MLLAGIFLASEVPEGLASPLKLARQKSKLAGTISGAFLVIKGED